MTQISVRPSMPPRPRSRLWGAGIAVTQGRCLVAAADCASLNENSPPASSPSPIDPIASREGTNHPEQATADGAWVWRL